MSIDTKTEIDLTKFPIFDETKINEYKVLFRRAFGGTLITLVSSEGNEQLYDIRTTLHLGVLVNEVSNYLENQKRLQPTH